MDALTIRPEEAELGATADALDAHEASIQAKSR